LRIPCFDVGAVEPERAGIGSAAQSDVYVGVLSIEVRDCRPLQSHAQVLLHAGQQFSGMPSKIEAFAKLWRDDQFEQALIASALPSVQRIGDVYVVGGGRKPGLPTLSLFGRALPCDVAAVRGPLPANAIG
jgi:hypothetical protein